jgi:hypothetical protein
MRHLCSLQGQRMINEGCHTVVSFAETNTHLEF